jgi:modulator of FtsH protease
LDRVFGTHSGAIAALTGLLFVATSLHVERIAKTPHWARRAFANTFSLIGVMIEALLVLVPQPANWLGAELIVLNLFLLVMLMLPLIREAGSGLSPECRRCDYLQAQCLGFWALLVARVSSSMLVAGCTF